MNYHVEHHMFPMVPYHALPAARGDKPDSPTPYHGLIEAYREIIPALLRQVKDPAYHVVRKLPDGAPAYDAGAAEIEARRGVKRTRANRQHWRNR